MARTDKPGSFKLNPHAPAFVPQHRAPHQPNSFQDVQADVADLVVAEGQKHVSHQPPSQLPATASSAAVAARDWLTELPTEVLEAVLGQLTDPADLASAARVCRRLHSTAGQAAVRLRVRVCPLGQRHSPPDAGVQRVRSMLEGICSSFPGVRELDLSACPVSDSDVLGMLRALPQLRILHLSGCKKLSPAMVTHALRTLQNRGSQGLEVAAKLQAISLQRCFQLTSVALTEAVHAAALRGAALRCVCLSHLQLADWPGPMQEQAEAGCQDPDQGAWDYQVAAEPEAAGAAAPDTVLFSSHDELADACAPGDIASSSSDDDAAPGTELRMSGLLAHATDGGSSSSSSSASRQPSAGLGSRDRSGGAGEDGVAAKRMRTAALESPGMLSLRCVGSTTGRSTGLHILALHNCDKLTSAGLRALAEGCPQLQMLLLGGSTFSAALSSPQEQLQTPPAEPAMWWHRTDVARLLGTAAGLPSRGASGSSRLQPHNGVLVRELVALASKLPALRVVELTFFPPGVAEAVADGLAEEATFAPPLIWDLCRRSSLREALTLLRTGHFPPASAADSARRAGGSFDSPGGFEGPDPMAQLTMALEAAANCSSAARQTPLHVAAEQGSLVLTQALLEVGVQVDARDRSGASALFTACEHGHCSVAALLLQAGAAGALQNSSGEAPLYIAALRGHMAVVDLLLAHFDWHHIPWQDPRLFGDGWTPLMAAAVADRRNIALRLLSAAGPDAAGFVRAANRYGQTAVHIAARRGSCHMLRILLAAGGAACAMEADKSGDTPQRIAGYNNHREAQALLADAVRRGTPPAAKAVPATACWTACSWDHVTACAQAGAL